MEIDGQIRQRLTSFIRQGRIVLFTGAGFSVSAQTKSGRQVPGVRELSEALWPIAFPSDNFEESSIADIYEAALQNGRNNTVKEMSSLLTVDPEKLDPQYEIWFSFPWHRVYTVNIDNLESAAERAFDLPRPLQVLSALEDAVPAPEAERLQVIHLNGMLDDLPEVTFSSRQYGQRQAGLDLWMAGLAIDLQTHPVLYVGTSLNEPPLWSYIEARGGKRTRREMRPGSFLVSPSLDRAKSVSLSLYNVSWIQGTAAEFSNEVLRPLEDEAAEGHRAIDRQAKAERGGPPVQRISELQEDSRGDEREFLLGREPRWSDLTNGFAIERSFDGVLAETYAKSTARLHVITGTAGSGKSTASMRLALQQAGDGRDVYALNRDAEGDLGTLRRAVKATQIDLLFVDNAVRYGKGIVQFFSELLDDSPDLKIVVCIRSSHMWALDDLKESALKSEEHVVPLLEESDTEALLDALDDANRLGKLKG